VGQMLRCDIHSAIVLSGLARKILLVGKPSSPICQAPPRTPPSDRTNLVRHSEAYLTHGYWLKRRFTGSVTIRRTGASG
jgi:hypothetical protein